MEGNNFFISFQDSTYPHYLKEIFKPPMQLHGKGEKKILKKPLISIVGTRKISSYGIKVIHEVLEELSEYSLCIVTGLAFGVDEFVHKIAFKYEIPTIAIMPCGINNDAITPRSHKRLAEQILENKGVILSEHTQTLPIEKYRYHERNRIIAGLSPITCIIEATLKSGSLMTARHALENNRDIIAIPGPVFSQVSKGTNHLISQGALTYLDPKTITNQLKQYYSLSFKEKSISFFIYESLKAKDKNLKQLSKELNTSQTVLKKYLLMLEIQKRIIFNANGTYSIQ